MSKKKETAVVPPVDDGAIEISVNDYAEFLKYLLARNTDDIRISKELAEAFISSMNGEHMHDVRDIIECYLKLDRHAAEFWIMKNKRDSN